MRSKFIIFSLILFIGIGFFFGNPMFVYGDTANFWDTTVEEEAKKRLEEIDKGFEKFKTEKEKETAIQEMNSIIQDEINKRAAGLSSKISSDLPGLIENNERVGFVSFLKWLFPFMLSTAAILAVLMIVIAGTRWVASAGSEAEIKAARDMITNAIIGLILAFAAWLIISTINPDILKGLL